MVRVQVPEAEPAEIVLGLVEEYLGTEQRNRLHHAWKVLRMRRAASTVPRRTRAGLGQKDSLPIQAGAPAWQRRLHQTIRIEGGVPPTAAGLLDDESGEAPVVDWYRFGDPATGGRLPQYIRRDLDADLVTALDRASADQHRYDGSMWEQRVILVVGPPLSGKTRSIIHHLGNHDVLGSFHLHELKSPSDSHDVLADYADASVAAVSAAPDKQQVRERVVFVDDFHRHFVSPASRRVRGTAARLHLEQIARTGAVVVLACQPMILQTPQPAEYGLTPEDQAWLATLALPELSADLSDDELVAARTAHPDRLSVDLRRAPELFAGVPTLLRRAGDAAAGDTATDQARLALMLALQDGAVLRPEGLSEDDLFEYTAARWRAGGANRPLREAAFERALEWAATPVGDRRSNYALAEFDDGLIGLLTALRPTLCADHQPLPQSVDRSGPRGRVSYGYAICDSDPAAAMQLWEQAADEGEPAAHFALGTRADLESDAAVAHLEMAARDDYPPALFELARRAMEDGDDERLQELILRAATTVTEPLKALMGDAYEFDVAEAMSAYRIADKARRDGLDPMLALQTHWAQRLQGADLTDEQAIKEAIRATFGPALTDPEVIRQSHQMERLAVRTRNADLLYRVGIMAWLRDEVAHAEELLALAGEAGSAPAAEIIAAFADSRGDDAEADRWYEIAADLGAPASLFRRGVIAKGQGDRDVARTAWTEAIRLGDVDALYELAWLEREEGDTDAARELLERAADLGHRIAPFDLGILARDGDNLASAEEYWLEADASGIWQASYHLGRLAERRESPGDARQWFLKAIEQGDDVESMARLAQMAHDEADHDQTAHWAQAAAERDHPTGHHLLAVMADGAGDRAAARAHHRAAADKGHVISMYLLGTFDLTDTAVEQAIAWLDRAAHGGHLHARFLVGLHRLSLGDIDEAERRWREACVAPGNLAALHHLAWRRESHDADEAEGWWRTAAAAGHGASAVELARRANVDEPLTVAIVVDERPRFTDDDGAELGPLLPWGWEPAVKEWWERAGEGGHAPAFHELAIEALCIERDVDRAIALWRRAAPDHDLSAAILRWIEATS